jgi:hypothetical protein
MKDNLLIVWTNIEIIHTGELLTHTLKDDTWSVMTI